MTQELINWFNGWRRDLDGFLVRARREGDPTYLESEVGFVQEACVAVRTHAFARELDRRAFAAEGAGK